MTDLFIDIETLPVEDSGVIQQFVTEAADRATEAINAISPPSNYKDPVKIQEYIANKHAEVLAAQHTEVEARVAKTSFDGMYGRVACIAWKWDGDGIQSTLPIHEDGDALQFFYDQLIHHLENSRDGHRDIKVIGHNVAGFDLTFLNHRSLVLGIKPPQCLRDAMAAKPWDKCVGDTMLMWSPDREKRVSLDRLCKVFGIKGKDGFDGSMVAEAWKNGEKAKVIDYCKDDVTRAYLVYQRLMWRS